MADLPPSRQLLGARNTEGLTDLVEVDGYRASPAPSSVADVALLDSYPALRAPPFRGVGGVLGSGVQGFPSRARGGWRGFWRGFGGVYAGNPLTSGPFARDTPLSSGPFRPETPLTSGPFSACPDATARGGPDETADVDSARTVNRSGGWSGGGARRRRGRTEEVVGPLPVARTRQRFRRPRPPPPSTISISPRASRAVRARR